MSTDSIRMTGSVRFQVFDKNDLLLTGDLELCNANGVVGEPKSSSKKWNIKCHSSASSSGFLKGKMSTGPDSAHPVVEVYVAGTFSSGDRASLFKGFLSTRTWVTQPSLGYNSLETSKFLRPKRRRLIFAAFI